MVKTGQPGSGIVKLPFASPVPGFQFEAIEFAKILHRFGADHLARPRRLEFYQILVLRSGAAREEVDFVRHDVRPGLVSFTRPGQVHRMWMSKPCDGRLLLFEPSFLPPGEHVAGTRRILPVVKSTLAIESAIGSLFRDYSGIENQRILRDVISHELAALLLRLQIQSELAPLTGAQRSAAPTLFGRFEESIEMTYAEDRSVTRIARELGCTEKTLGRACLAATGLSPKAIIQQRVALEAKRILAHTDEPIKEIASRLGFSESTNFVKFFRRSTGELPTAFRRRFQRAV